MKNYEVKLDIEPKDNYEIAKNALIKAKDAFDELTPQDQYRLVQELLGAEAMGEFLKIMQYHG